MNNPYLFKQTLLSSLFFVSSVVAAAPAQINGFVSQGYIYSTDNPVFQDETGGHFDFRELGINFTWQATSNLRFAAQALSRKLGDLDDGDPKLDFALIDYHFALDKDSTAGARLGRLKNQYGIYNNTRDAPHARPGVLTPQSIYFETFRDALLSVDGFNLYYTSSRSWGDLNIGLYAGQTDLNSEVIEVQIYTRDIVGEFKDSDISGFNISYAPGGLSGLSVGFSLLQASMELDDTPTFTPEEQLLGGLDLLNNPQNYFNYITGTKIEPQLHLLSAQYTHDSFVFTGEYLLIDIEFSDFEVLNQPSFSSEFEMQGYYLQAEWLFSDKLSFYSRFEDLVYNVDDRDGEDFAAVTGGNPVTQFERAYTLGGRWYLTPDLSVTGEYSKNEGTAFINGPTEIDYQSLVRDWDLYLLQVSYHF